MSYKGSSGPPSRTGSATNRLGPGRASATSSLSSIQTKSSVTKTQTAVIQKTSSGTKIQTQSKLTARTITKVPSQASSGRQGEDGSSAGIPPSVARIRLASRTNKDPRTSVQTTKVVVTGTGLKPTGKVIDTKVCKAKCATGTGDPLLQPFTEQVERGQPVPAGRYYIPISGAPDQYLGPEEKKLRQKLQKYTPTGLSHWKVDPNDAFARKPGPVKQVHPDIISGTFRAAQGTYEPEYANPLLEQRLDPSMPEPYWSVSLQEAMSHASEVYEHENPDHGQKEQYMVENTVIERQITAELPGVGARSSPGPSGCVSPGPSGRVSPGPSGRVSPGPSGRVCPGPSGRVSPGPSGRVNPGPSGRVSPGPSGRVGPSPFGPSPSNSGARPCPAPCALPSSALSGPSSRSPCKLPPSDSGALPSSALSRPCRLSPSDSGALPSSALSRPSSPSSYRHPPSNSGALPSSDLSRPSSPSPCRHPPSDSGARPCPAPCALPSSALSRPSSPSPCIFPPSDSGAPPSSALSKPSRLPPSNSGARPCPAPCALPSSALSRPSSPSPCRHPPSDSGARPCPAPCASSDLSRPSSSCSRRPPSPDTQQTRAPCKEKCSKQPLSPLVQPDLPSNLPPQINPPAQSAPIITIQPPTPQLQPDFEHSVNVQMVPAPRMQSPVAEINAQKTINMQRLVQAGPQGTNVLTLLRGKNLVSPCAANQIDIMKQENLPPPSPSRPLARQVAAPYEQISSQLQYVIPPKEECYSPQMRTSPERNYPLPDPYSSPPPSPLLTHRGQLPQGYGMTAQQRYLPPMEPMSPSLQPTSPFKHSPGYGQRPATPEMCYGRSTCPPRPPSTHGRSPFLQVPNSGQRPVTAQRGPPLLQVPGSWTKLVTPIKKPITPSKMAPTVTPIRLEAAAPVPLSPADASLDVVRRLVDEERQDVVLSQELPLPLTRKLNKLKKKPQSMRVLEETLDQSVPIDEESETLKSDVIAELMYSQETGVINPASSPRKTYEQLFPPLEDEQPIAISPAAPAPLHDIVVPMGEATIDSVAVVNEDIKEISEAVAEGTEIIPEANAFAEAMKNDTEGQLTSQSPPREHKSREERSAADVKGRAGEEGAREKGSAEKAATTTPAKERDEGAEYIPRGELEEQKAPWDINLGSLEDLVGGKMSMISAWDNLPSNESVRATAKRLEYVLDVQKPLHHSCVQLRGSQMPAWFPGFYSVFPQVDGFVRLEKTPSRAFASAWHVFAPYQSAEQSEVVIL